ncbi:flagellar hook-basal body complex protein FliE [Gallaecimonas xiamenensis]|uniref:Flagellar hook-basal body complex protein FliE n=1 Tax=Gallaecimonas xiamenensis 3-C-1 TaxID=745411 RepID=K2IY62_9GAMM|nr:flagellar hook-basal body complex protein FliE [Gallaecimonas xiamenensis]EKE75421.1 flagellar hook-basal body complex subunit FliE [Gallaecimonas xiamenensis 3-C-1]
MNTAGANSVMLQEMQSLIREAQGPRGSRELQGLSLGNPEGMTTRSVQSDFASLFNQALDKVNGLQQNSAAKQTAVEMGDPNVSVADAMIASQKAGIAFQATVQVRNKLVQAYQDVMNMPV